MTTAIRFARFNIVGAMGIGVQLATVAGLVHGLGADPVVATGVGVSAAVVHNFTWHVRWTWRDRMGIGVSRLGAFVRFAGANGAVSLIGSVAMMPLLLGVTGLGPIAANIVTIAACGVLNYWLGDGSVFHRFPPNGDRPQAMRPVPDQGKSVENRPVP